MAPAHCPSGAVPEDRSQPRREGEALLDFGQLVGSGFKTRDPCALNASPWGKKAAGSQRGTERLKRGKGRGFSPDSLCPLKFFAYVLVFLAFGVQR